MSWDILVQDLPPDAKSVAEIPAHFRPAPIGKRLEIIDSITAVVPTADFSDPCWGLIIGNGWSIEVNIGPEEECRSFAFHVRGRGDAAVGVVAAVLHRLNLRALDSQTGKFFVPGNEAIDSYRKWQKYRDDVTTRNNS
jgi:hypothetical protein